jgi:hypothetical protein
VGTGNPFPWVYRLYECEADNSSPLVSMVNTCLNVMPPVLFHGANRCKFSSCVEPQV